MNYLLDLFSPETWTAFRETDATIAVFRDRYRKLAGSRVHSGDIFLCYLTRLSRWCGALEVESGPHMDDSPLHDELDAFPVRFKVKPLVILEPEFAIPIRSDKVWNALSITREFTGGQSHWTGFFRSALNRFTEADGAYLINLLEEQQSNPERYPFTDKDKQQLAPKRKVRTLQGEVEVEVPDHVDSETVDALPTLDGRESIRYQAKVAQIGVEMGFRIWVPRNDRARVLENTPSMLHDKFLDDLPLNYDDTTLRTVEHIDVIWLKGRSMARAFEIEHTTAIYSGLLRMADLLALQPNMDIRLHIVAPPDKREKVLREIRRPVFSLLERGPLYEQCSYLSYESIDQLAEAKHLSHMSDTILAEYEESTDEV